MYLLFPNNEARRNRTHPYISEGQMQKDVEAVLGMYLCRSFDYVDKYFEMNPETDDLLSNGAKLREGMIVLIESDGLRVALTDLDSRQAVAAARKYNRWMTVSEITMHGGMVHFIGIYNDGTKKSHSMNELHAWYVKKHSIPQAKKDTRHCYVCSVDLSEGETIATHFQAKHPKNSEEVKPKEETSEEQAEKPSTCHTCGKSFLTYSLLISHVANTHLVKNGESVCGYCTKVFDSKSIKDHVRTEHSNATWCFICSGELTPDETLAKHYAEIHPDYSQDLFEDKPKRSVCGYCKCDFDSKDMATHQLEVHH